jgi:hypothetical protein
MMNQLFRFAVAALFVFAAAGVQAQTEKDTVAAVPSARAQDRTDAALPLLREYRGIAIGMPGEGIREKLGKAKVNDDAGFLFDLADDERVQVTLDGERKVSAIVVFYDAGNKKAPKYEDIFGPGSKPPAKDDGSIYHLVSYPGEGYWVAYNRLAGENAMIIVTMQKIPGVR